MFCNNVLVNLNELPYGRQNQTNRRNIFRKTSAMNHNFWLTRFAMIHRVEIAFLFMSLERLRLEREQLWLELEQLTSDTSFTL